MKTSVKVLISGAILLVGGALVGVGAAWVGMGHSFAAPASASASRAAEDTAHFMISLAIGIPVFLLGLCLGIGGAVTHLLGKKNSGIKEKDHDEA